MRINEHWNDEIWNLRLSSSIVFSWDWNQQNLNVAYNFDSIPWLWIYGYFFFYTFWFNELRLQDQANPKSTTISLFLLFYFVLLCCLGNFCLCQIICCTVLPSIRKLWKLRQLCFRVSKMCKLSVRNQSIFFRTLVTLQTRIIIAITLANRINQPERFIIALKKCCQRCRLYWKKFQLYPIKKIIYH